MAGHWRFICKKVEALQNFRRDDRPQTPIQLRFSTEEPGVVQGVRRRPRVGNLHQALANSLLCWTDRNSLDDISGEKTSASMLAMSPPVGRRYSASSANAFWDRPGAAEIEIEGTSSSTGRRGVGLGMEAGKGIRRLVHDSRPIRYL